MRTKDFIAQLDHPRIVAAIAAAELRTSGEIRVYLERGALSGEALEVATRKFLEFGMDKTAARNAVLILVAPRAQKFAVVGDEGIHQKCGAEYWQRLVDTMRDHFKRSEFTDALVDAINTVGESLATHFPRQPDDQDELPNTILET